MRDGVWYPIPPIGIHRCCECGFEHRVDIAFTGQTQPNWRWVKLRRAGGRALAPNGGRGETAGLSRGHEPHLG